MCAIISALLPALWQGGDAFSGEFVSCVTSALSFPAPVSTPFGEEGNGFQVQPAFALRRWFLNLAVPSHLLPQKNDVDIGR
eukprot:2055320-Pyramimonas_sp.AAC.1